MIPTPVAHVLVMYSLYIVYMRVYSSVYICTFTSRILAIFGYVVFFKYAVQ